MTVLTVRKFSFACLELLCEITQSLCGALLVGVAVRRRDYVLPCCIPPFLQWFPLYSFLYVLGENFLESCPFIEFSGFSAPLPNIFIESGCLCQKGDPFRRHHRISNFLPS